jgi:hypothetical protein
MKNDKPKAAQVAKPLLSEADKRALFALLAVVALCAIAYAAFAASQQDPPSDGSDFYLLLLDSQKVGLLYDARSPQSDAQQSAIYQCGIDMISKGRFAGKEVVNIGCDAAGCLYTTTGQNGSSRMPFSEAQKRLYSEMPYILIKPGEGGYAFFKRHMEIYIPANVTPAASYCDFSATEG